MRPQQKSQPVCNLRASRLVLAFDKVRVSGACLDEMLDLGIAAGIAQFGHDKRIRSLFDSHGVYSELEGVEIERHQD